MATFKRVGATLSHNTDTTIYTAPSKGAIVIGIVVSHKGVNEAAYGIQLKARSTGGAEVFLLGKNVLLPQKTSLTLDTKVILQPGETLKAFAPPVDSGIVVAGADINISIMEL